MEIVESKNFCRFWNKYPAYFDQTLSGPIIFQTPFKISIRSLGFYSVSCFHGAHNSLLSIFTLVDLQPLFRLIFGGFFLIIGQNCSHCLSINDLFLCSCIKTASRAAFLSSGIQTYCSQSQARGFYKQKVAQRRNNGSRGKVTESINHALKWQLEIWNICRYLWHCIVYIDELCLTLVFSRILYRGKVESEPLTPDMFDARFIHPTAGPLHCANMSHLIESDTESIVVYSKVTLANLDMKTIAWAIFPVELICSWPSFCPRSDNIMKNETVTIFWHSSVWL